ncbi:MAG: ATP-binding cassette domain-containing protein [Candidatus Eisenbacteria bacterium]|nr:ATP-binding cassette domain-containing protein [Candidatus Eisenbacteria bacterium]
MLEASNLSFVAGGRTVLDRMSCAVRPATVLALVGPNGAGKTTVLRHLAGEIVPQSGGVRLDGLPLAAWPAETLARRRAVVSAQTIPGNWFRVSDLLDLATGETDAGAIDASPLAPSRRSALLAALDLSGSEAARLDRLSSGEQQRLRLVAALLQLGGDDLRGRYLLLDEPTSHQDPRHLRGIEVLLRAVREQGAGIVLSTHDLALAARLGDEAVLIHGGAFIAQGAPHEILTPTLLLETYGVPLAPLRDAAGRIAAFG